MLLQPREQDGEPGAAPDSHHLGATAQLPLLIEQIDDARAALRQQRGDHRAVEAHQRDRGQDDAQCEEQPAADLASQELQGQHIRPRREPDARAVQRVQKVAGAEAEEGDADEQEGEPAFNTHAQVQPARHAHHSPTFLMPLSSSLSRAPVLA